jgi:hypothetical protein
MGESLGGSPVPVKGMAVRAFYRIAGAPGRRAGFSRRGTAIASLSDVFLTICHRRETRDFAGAQSRSLREACGWGSEAREECSARLHKPGEKAGAAMLRPFCSNCGARIQNFFTLLS